MSERTDPRRAVNRQSDVAAVLETSRARVQAHSNPDVDFLGPFVRRERTLSVDRGLNCIRRVLEDEEERVSLGVDLEAAATLDRLAHQLLVQRERSAVLLTQAAEQLGRSLDVREQKRHGAGRLLGHGRTIDDLLPRTTRPCRTIRSRRLPLRGSPPG